MMAFCGPGIPSKGIPSARARREVIGESGIPGGDDAEVMEVLFNGAR